MRRATRGPERPFRRKYSLKEKGKSVKSKCRPVKRVDKSLERRREFDPVTMILLVRRSRLTKTSQPGAAP